MPDERNTGKPHEPGEFDGVTRLFIRTHPADDGSVPLPSALPFWTSPDIAIVKPGGAVGGEAIPLEQNQVRVTVWNSGGIPAVDAYVDVFVADPSTVITPATSKPIGGVFVTVQGYNSTTVDIPWVPEAADSGHRCLIARVSLIAPPDTYTDPTIFDVVGDRHVAQRNISVLAIASGQSMTFRFLMNPQLATSTVPVRLVAVERPGNLQPQELVRMAGCEGGLPANQPLAAVGVRMLSRKESRAEPSLRGEGRVRLGVPTRARQASEIREAAGKLDPSLAPRIATVTFTVSADDEPGRLHVVDVMQVDPTTDEIQGGLTFIIKVT